LKSAREKAGLYQEEVAKRIGLSIKSGKGYISHLEKGRVKNPPVLTILLYLRAFETSSRFARWTRRAASRFSSFHSDDALRCA
ncbi:MAG: helix-turn-helix transcriptional regulator, partial [bacterium]